MNNAINQSDELPHEPLDLETHCDNNAIARLDELFCELLYSEDHSDKVAAFKSIVAIEDYAKELRERATEECPEVIEAPEDSTERKGRGLGKDDFTHCLDRTLNRFKWIRDTAATGSPDAITRISFEDPDIRTDEERALPDSQPECEIRELDPLSEETLGEWSAAILNYWKRHGYPMPGARLEECGYIGRVRINGVTEEWLLKYPGIAFEPFRGKWESKEEERKRAERRKLLKKRQEFEELLVSTRPQHEAQRGHYASKIEELNNKLKKVEDYKIPPGVRDSLIRQLIKKRLSSRLKSVEKNNEE